MEEWTVWVKVQVVPSGGVITTEMTLWQEVCLMARLGKASEPEIAFVRRKFSRRLPEDDRASWVGEQVLRRLYRKAKLPYPPPLFGPWLELLPRKGRGRSLPSGNDAFGWLKELLPLRIPEEHKGHIRL